MGDSVKASLPLEIDGRRAALGVGAHGASAARLAARTLVCLARTMTLPPLQPHETIWTLTNAVVPSTCLHVIAELGVADHIGDAPASASELASRCGVDADALGRVLRLLCDHGVFEQADGGFRHSPASELLRTRTPGVDARLPR